jgi:hypothetical protein
LLCSCSCCSCCSSSCCSGGLVQTSAILTPAEQLQQSVDQRFDQGVRRW